MEGDQGTSTPSDEATANSAAASDSFSQLWTDVMGMLVSLGGRGDTTTEWQRKLTATRDFSSSTLTLICRMSDCVAN